MILIISFIRLTMATYRNIFKITHNGLLPFQGSILISEPFLQDLYFHRSVVLLTEHTSQGSMGFILNKKTNLLVNSFFSEFKDFPAMPIYLGGPVCSNRLFFIHTLGDILIPDACPVRDQLYFDGDFDTLKQYILNGHSIEGKIKFFLGYSGWDKGQLNEEINKNSWVVSHKTDLDLIQANGDSFWKNAVETLGADYKTWTKYPKDPYLN